MRSPFSPFASLSRSVNATPETIEKKPTLFEKSTKNVFKAAVKVFASKRSKTANPNQNIRSRAFNPADDDPVYPDTQVPTFESLRGGHIYQNTDYSSQFDPAVTEFPVQNYDFMHSGWSQPGSSPAAIYYQGNANHPQTEPHHGYPTPECSQHGTPAGAPPTIVEDDDDEEEDKEEEEEDIADDGEDELYDDTPPHNGNCDGTIEPCPWPVCHSKEKKKRRSHIRRKHIKGLMCPIPGCGSRWGEQTQVNRHIKNQHKRMHPRKALLQDESEINFYQHALFETIENSTTPKYQLSFAVKQAIGKAKTLDDLRAIPELRNNPELDPKLWRNIKRLPSRRTSKATCSENLPSLTKTSTQRRPRTSNPPLSMVSETQQPYSERSTSRMERTAHVLAFLLHIDQIEDEIGNMEQYTSDLMRLALRKLPDMIGGDKSIQSPIILDGRHHHVWLYSQSATSAQFQPSQMAVQLPAINTTNLPPMIPMRMQSQPGGAFQSTSGPPMHSVVEPHSFGVQHGAVPMLGNPNHHHTNSYGVHDHRGSVIMGNGGLLRSPSICGQHQTSIPANRNSFQHIHSNGFGAQNQYQTGSLFCSSLPSPITPSFGPGQGEMPLNNTSNMNSNGHQSQQPHQPHHHSQNGSPSPNGAQNFTMVNNAAPGLDMFQNQPPYFFTPPEPHNPRDSFSNMDMDVENVNVNFMNSQSSSIVQRFTHRPLPHDSGNINGNRW